MSVHAEIGPAVGRRLSSRLSVTSTLTNASPVVTSQGNRVCLCPRLLVPENSECTVEMPPGTTSVLNLPGARVMLSTTSGKPLLCASFDRSSPRGRGPTEKLILSSTVDDEVFASCYLEVPDNDPTRQPIGIIICGSSGDQFGRLAAVTSHSRWGRGFNLSTPAGQMFFQDRGARVVRVLDGNGFLAAVAEELVGPSCINARTVTAGPHVDIGLIALSLMGIDWLTSDQDKIKTGGTLVATQEEPVKLRL